MADEILGDCLDDAVSHIAGDGIGWRGAAELPRAHVELVLLVASCTAGLVRGFEEVTLPLEVHPELQALDGACAGAGFVLCAGIALWSSPRVWRPAAGMLAAACLVVDCMANCADMCSIACCMLSCCRSRWFATHQMQLGGQLETDSQMAAGR